jgi:tetratricopeptide (TPR) repeat protein
MRRWALTGIAMMVAVVGVLTVTAAGPDAKELAQKGYSTFREVISGDHAKLPQAISYMEQARSADGTNTANLYNLARAYFFDAITFDKHDSLFNAEKTFGRLVELDPSRTDAMAFHGAILAQMSGGTDMGMFMRGAQELKTASERTPDDITVRLVVAFVTRSVPPEGHAFLGVTNPVGNLQFIGKVFDSYSSDFAPHVSVVMNAFIGEGLLANGQREEARASFEKALKEPEPFDSGQLAGRKRLKRG